MPRGGPIDAEEPLASRSTCALLLREPSPYPVNVVPRKGGVSGVGDHLREQVVEAFETLGRPYHGGVSSRILIVGGGYIGMYAARHLERRLYSW